MSDWHPMTSRCAGLRRRLTGRSARRWLCPSQDVPSCVHVAIKDEAAVETGVRANRERLSLLGFAAAARADLGRSARVHQHECATSFSRFEAQYVGELAPPRVMDVLREERAGEAGGVQVFGCDEVVSAHEV